MREKLAPLVGRPIWVTAILMPKFKEFQYTTRDEIWILAHNVRNLSGDLFTDHLWLPMTTPMLELPTKAPVSMLAVVRKYRRADRSWDYSLFEPAQLRLVDDEIKELLTNGATSWSRSRLLRQDEQT